MQKTHTLNDFKTLVQSSLDSNIESMEEYGRSELTQLKAYLIESNTTKVTEVNCPIGQWKSLENADGWFTNISTDNSSNKLFLDASSDRVWKLYSLLNVNLSDYTIDAWIKGNKGLDNCWLSRGHLLRWEGKVDWDQRGVGVKFSDGLSTEEEASKFSLKAWHGAEEKVPGLKDIIDLAKSHFAINSIRWQKKSNGTTSLIAEWYSNGKVTINRASDIEEVLLTTNEMALNYRGSLVRATELRNSTLGAFEILFTQKIDLKSFRDVVTDGKGGMKLWLIEVDSEPEYHRYKGVDLHNWDRVMLDIGPDFAYLVVPGKGCVNAAPRIANLQGIDNAGRTTILFDGEEVFV